MSDSKYIGPTKGNTDLPPCRSDSTGQAGSKPSESGPSGKYIGKTKGNSDLPPERSSGVQSGMAGKYIAGRNKPY